MTHIFRGECAHSVCNFCLPVAVARKECCKRFAVGNIKARFPRHQQFARGCGHGIKQHRLVARRTQNLSRHQPRRPGTDDGNFNVFGFVLWYAVHRLCSKDDVGGNVAKIRIDHKDGVSVGNQSIALGRKRNPAFVVSLGQGYSSDVQVGDQFFFCVRTNSVPVTVVARIAELQIVSFDVAHIIHVIAHLIVLSAKIASIFRGGIVGHNKTSSSSVVATVIKRGEQESITHFVVSNACGLHNKAQQIVKVSVNNISTVIDVIVHLKPCIQDTRVFAESYRDFIDRGTKILASKIKSVGNQSPSKINLSVPNCVPPFKPNCDRGRHQTGCKHCNEQYARKFDVHSLTPYTFSGLGLRILTARVKAAYYNLCKQQLRTGSILGGCRGVGVSQQSSTRLGVVVDCRPAD